MLKRIELTNFRKHKDLSIEMGEGLMVLRAQNEGGKSTILEAMLYALYGSRVLRNSLANTVTYGLRDSQLRVEALFNFGGDDYLFIRHKGGAEVYVNGSESPYVTGQTEVSTFAAQLVGADAVTANKLMMATQGNLRGALEQGPKATAEMIEDLADFDLFDFLIDEMGRKLPLGSPTHMERTLNELKEELEGIGSGTDYDQAIKSAKGALNQLKKEESELEVSIEKGRKEQQIRTTNLELIRNQNREVENAKKELKSVQWSLECEKKELVKIDEVLSRPLNREDVTTLESRIAQAKNHEKLRTIFVAFTELPSTDVEWEGDRESLETYIRDKEREKHEAVNTALNLSYQIEALKSKWVHDKTCPTCKQPIQNAEALNQDLEQKIAELTAQHVAKKQEVDEITETLDELNSFVKTINPIFRFLDRHSEYVVADHSVTPPRVEWAGEPVSPDNINIEAEQVKLEKLKKEINESDRQSARREGVVRLIEQFEKQVESLKLAVSNANVTNVDDLVEEVQQIENLLNEQVKALTKVRDDVLTTHSQIQTLENRKTRDTENRESLKKQIKNLEDNISELGFNNELLKKVRLARPLVSDQLWNMVLAMVSTIFTKVRGVRSVVTKDKDGFKVNGEDVTGLSGSTLDVLGASIRVALLRTFVPNCPFVVYDEPFAAMDDDRTQSMLSFIQSCGFRQTLVVTHEDISEQVADQIITL